MAWFRRGGPEPAEHGSASADVDAGPSPSGYAVPAWPSAARLQRTLADPPDTAGLRSFEATLTTRQDPRFLEPLGHHVVAEAPGGLVERVATPRSFPVPLFHGSVV